jgi:D-alanine-D-alanine ligase-like ATP-grasp enzyme
MTNIRVGVVRGGEHAYEQSLHTGAVVLNALPREKYEPHDIFVDTHGVWHVGGFPFSVEQAVRRFDVIFNALDGNNEGVIRALERLHVPFTGSGSLATNTAQHRVRSKEIYAKNNLRTPLHTVFDSSMHNEKDIREIFRTFPHPTLVHPSIASPRNDTVVYTLADLTRAIEEAQQKHGTTLIEMHIPGKRVSCLVTDDFRGDAHHTSFPVHTAHEHVQLSREEKEEVQRMSRQAHVAFDARHYSVSDCVVSPRGVYIVETKTAPAFGDDSALVRSLVEIGIPLPQYLDHIVSLSLGK